MLFVFCVKSMMVFQDKQLFRARGYLLFKMEMFSFGAEAKPEIHSAHDDFAWRTDNNDELHSTYRYLYLAFAAI